MSTKRDTVLPILTTASELSGENPVLPLARIAQESDTGISKLGDGVTAYNSLGFAEVAEEYTPASGTDTYTATYKLNSVKGYFTGLRLRVKFTNANTGASTINLNSFGAKDIRKNVSTALASGDILAGGIYEIVYDGTNFQITTPTGNIPTATPTLAQVLAAGNDGGGQTITNTVWNGSVITATYGGTGINNGTSTLTLSGNAAYTLSGGGTISLGGFTLTVPATGTAALGTGASTRIAYWSSANTLTSSANVTTDGNSLTVGTSVITPIIQGSTAASGSLTLRATSNATDGDIIFQSDSTTERARLLSSGEFLVGYSSLASVEEWGFRKNQNSFSSLMVANTTSGTAAGSAIQVTTSATIATQTAIFAMSAGYTSSGIIVADAGVLYSNMAAGLNIGTASNTQMSFWTNNTERARLLSGGDLIIGATTALQAVGKLEVQHNSNSYTQVLCSNVSAGASVGNGFNAANGTTNFYYGVYGTGRTTSGLIVANRGYFYSDNAAGINIGCSAAGDVRFFTGGLAATNQRMKITSLASVVIGNNSAALATNATDGFLYIPTCAGTPTGVPTAQTGTVAMVFDTSNNKLYIYDGGWLGGTTPGAFT